MFGSALLCSLLIAILINNYPSENIEKTLPYNNIGQPRQMFTVINLTSIVFLINSDTCDTSSTLHHIILVNSALGNKVVMCIVICVNFN